MDRKTAAQKLIDIANSIDKQAAEETFFICRSCNHTASLASINGKRAKVASEAGVGEVDAVTVNDVVSCPACQGDMRYVPTEISEKYYVEAADDEDIADAPKPEDAPPAPVPEDKGEAAPEKPAEEPPADLEEDEEIDLSYGGDEEDVDETEPAPAEETPPAEDVGEPAPVEEAEVSEESVTEPEPEFEDPKPEPKKKPKKKDKPDDGKPNIPKDRVPKFEFPKRASSANDKEVRYCETCRRVVDGTPCDCEGHIKEGEYYPGTRKGRVPTVTVNGKEYAVLGDEQPGSMIAKAVKSKSTTKYSRDETDDEKVMKYSGLGEWQQSTSKKAADKETKEEKVMKYSGPGEWIHSKKAGDDAFMALVAKYQ
jgi:hypothetical protein